MVPDLVAAQLKVLQIARIEKSCAFVSKRRFRSQRPAVAPHQLDCEMLCPHFRLFSER
jgi:hypothetical protein